MALNVFEEQFKTTFKEVRRRHGAYIFQLFPPVRPVKSRGKCPTFVMSGRALFDFAGWSKDGRFIGIELKSNEEYKTALAIVGPNNHASGLAFHQLEALAAVQRDGGQAYLLWKNSGRVGRLAGDAVAERFKTYIESLKNEEETGKIIKGTRSIPWGEFTEVEKDLSDWYVEEQPPKDWTEVSKD